MSVSTLLAVLFPDTAKVLISGIQLFWDETRIKEHHCPSSNVFMTSVRQEVYVYGHNKLHKLVHVAQTPTVRNAQ